MKIKRYMAVSMRAALDQVRLEQGPDAVILSSRRMDEGIEVIAAVDYDEALFAGAARQYALAATAAATAANASAAASAPASAPTTAPAIASARTARPASSQSPSAAPRMAQQRAPSALARDLAAVAIPQDPQRGFATVQRELKELREMLETSWPHMSWNDRRIARAPEGACSRGAVSDGHCAGYCHGAGEAGALGNRA